METLQRMKFTQVEESLVDQRMQLAKESSELLGYSLLAKAIATPGALLFSLRALGIEPLVRSGVEKYKRSKATPGMWSGHKLGATLMACVALLAGAIIPGVLRLYGQGRWDNPGCIIIIATAALLTLVLGIIGLINLFDSSERGERIVRLWKTFPLNIYTGNVPEFALMKALQVKRECPKAEFYVEQLHEDVERIPRPLPDPFLFVKLGDELYYLEVWDEKEYEAKL